MGALFDACAIRSIPYLDSGLGNLAARSHFPANNRALWDHILRRGNHAQMAFIVCRFVYQAQRLAASMSCERSIPIEYAVEHVYTTTASSNSAA